VPELVFRFRDDGKGALLVEIAHRFGAAVHLLVLGGADEDVGGRVRVALAERDHPALQLVVVLEEEGRDRTENQMPGAQRAEMRVEIEPNMSGPDLG